MEIFFGVGAGDTLTSTPNDTQHSLVRPDHRREHCSLFPPKYALPITWPIAELGVLVSNLPAEKPAISLPRVTARCRAKIVRAAAIFSTANHSRLSAQDVSSDVKFPRGPRNMGCPVPGLTSNSRPHLNCPRCPSLGFRFASGAVRTGPDGALPSTASLSLPTASVIATSPPLSIKFYWLALHAGPVCFRNG